MAWSIDEGPAENPTIILSNVTGGLNYEIGAACVSIYGLESSWIDCGTIVAVGNPRGPGAVTGFTAAVSGQSLVLTWDPVTGLAIKCYEIRSGTDWSTATLVAKVEAVTHRIGPAAAGAHHWLIKAVDAYGTASDIAAAASLPVLAPSTPAPSAVIVGELCVVTWADCSTTLPVWAYTVNGLQGGAGLKLQERVNWTGSKTYSVTARDTAGNVSGTGTCTAAIIADPPATALTPTGITRGISLDVIISPGADFDALEIWSATVNNRASAVKVGETAAAKWTHAGLGLVDIRYYWVRPRDKYGNYGSWYPTSATGGVSGATSTAPDDYLTILEGALTASQLATDLQKAVNKIDGSGLWVEPGWVEDGWVEGLSAAYTTDRAHFASLDGSVASLNSAVSILSGSMGGDGTFTLTILEHGSLPSAATPRIAMVHNASWTPAYRLSYADGTNWRTMDDNTIIT